MRFRLLILVLVLFLLLGYCFYPRQYSKLPFFNSSLELSDWMRDNLSYQHDKENYWQSPNETVKRHGGDCEDFAILANVALKRLGIDSIICILYDSKNDDNNHAVCVFKEGEYYSIFDCQYLVESKDTNLKELLQHHYSIYSIAFILTQNKCLLGFINLKEK